MEYRLAKFSSQVISFDMDCSFSDKASEERFKRFLSNGWVPCMMSCEKMGGVLLIMFKRESKSGSKRK